MNKAILIILDGWGLGKKDNQDAIYKGKTPFIDSLYEKFPNGTLRTFGKHVGLPEGQMGNSEVGHMNIGAGRVVYQMLAQIHQSFEEKEFETKQLWQSIINELKTNPTKNIHFLGLVSDGGVHSHVSHLSNMLHLLTQAGLDHQALIHAITDGRDTDPKSGLNYLTKLLEDPKIGKAKIASICGRYYAMDRDKRWERTKLAYDLLTEGKGEIFDNPIEAIKSRYKKEETDEFLKPISIQEGTKIHCIKKEDIVICFNFRTDRARQITEALTINKFDSFPTKNLRLRYCTFSEYDKKFEHIPVFFKKEDLNNTLGEVLSKYNKTQIRAAETEKYPHVTFFFSGGRENPFFNEERVLVNSPKVATYDLQPEMSAEKLSRKILEKLDSTPDFICLNFANPDMVGHTGIFEAIVKSVETVDKCLESIVKKGISLGYQFFITADHGNAEQTQNSDGTPHTAHTTNLVPFFIVSPRANRIQKQGILADIAPTLLEMLAIQKPVEMTGKSLIA
ncbi:MAG: 2,3-bisphosphoglycerate-independent phosphoglycerate mutase [Bacteroidota bacterium]|nr:2,3-bisphosphoglycerate-independent phosphoglycerate mutase [Bacteroidota bacterium]